MKTKERVISVLLLLCILLSGCSNKENIIEPSSVEPVSDTTIMDNQLLVGHWEGFGIFDSYAQKGQKCEYTLDFFEDGKTTISSSNLYFYGVEIEDITVDDNYIYFTLPYSNPFFDTVFPIPTSDRALFKISISMEINQDEMIGKSKQGQWEFGVSFKRTSKEPIAYIISETMTQEQMLEDAEVLFKVLENEHPDIFYVQSKEEYNMKKTDFINKIPSLNKKSFYYEINRFVSSIHDAHTGLPPARLFFENTKKLPFNIEYYSGKWHIIETDKQYEALLGKELVAVNNLTIKEVYDKVVEFVRYENQATARNSFKRSISDADLLEYIGLVKDGQITITVDKNEQATLSVVEQDNPLDAKLGPDVMAKTAYQDDSYYRYEILDNETFFVQYNSCNDFEGYPISQFGIDVANELNKKEYKNFIIDLRYNGGGYSHLIYSFINPILEAHKKGAKLYCLIGGGTFSSGFQHAIELKKEGATLVGQPTGGNMQQFTFVVPFVLPNSGFSGSYSTRFMDYDYNAPYDSLYPDKQIDHTIESYIKGIDEEIEYIKKKG